MLGYVGEECGGVGKSVCAVYSGLRAGFDQLWVWACFVCVFVCMYVGVGVCL